MSTSNNIPVVILNGFLGSGKTTLFQKLLSQARKKGITVRAVVNDMSELDVDGALIREACGRRAIGISIGASIGARDFSGSRPETSTRCCGTNPRVESAWGSSGRGERES